MTQYVKVVSGVVVQRQPYAQTGFIEAPDSVVCGMILENGEYVNPPPPPKEPIYPQFTALEMLDLFTEAEQLAVVGATMVEPAVKLWYDRLIAATFVTYEDPRTEGGLQALVDAELLTPQRKAEIVAAMQPETEPT